MQVTVIGAGCGLFLCYLKCSIILDNQWLDQILACRILGPSPGKSP